MLSPEDQHKINVWRQKSKDGTLTKEDSIQIIETLRQGRKSAAVASKSASSGRASAREQAKAINGDDLLADF